MELLLITSLILAYTIAIILFISIYKTKQKEIITYVPMLDKSLAEDLYQFKQKYKALVISKEKMHQNLEKQVKINSDLNSQLEAIYQLQNKYKG